MNKLLFIASGRLLRLLPLFMFMPFCALAQDEIKLKQYGVIYGKVEQVGTHWIYYSKGKKKQDSVSRSEVIAIRYENGMIASFRDVPKTEINWYHWKHFPLGSQWIGYATIIGSPVLTALPALMVSRKGPDPKHYVIADSSRLHDSLYMAEVHRVARDFKRKSTWKLYGRGSLLFALIWGVSGSIAMRAGL